MKFAEMIGCLPPRRLLLNDRQLAAYKCFADIVYTNIFIPAFDCACEERSYRLGICMY